MGQAPPRKTIFGTRFRRLVHSLSALDKAAVDSLVPLYQGPGPGWLRRRGSGLILERSATSKLGVVYTLAVRRRWVPDDIGPGIAALIYVGGLAAFTVLRIRHRGYQLELSRNRRKTPGSWRRLRPLIEVRTVVVGPFATVAECIAEADAVALLLAAGEYAAAP